MQGELLVISGVPLTAFGFNCIFNNAYNVSWDAAEKNEVLIQYQHHCVERSPQSITEVSLPPPSVPQQEQWQTITGLCASAVSPLSFPGGIDRGGAK